MTIVTTCAAFLAGYGACLMANRLNKKSNLSKEVIAMPAKPVYEATIIRGERIPSATIRYVINANDIREGESMQDTAERMADELQKTIDVTAYVDSVWEV